MFERFTDRGRRVVVLAQEEARISGHLSVGTEHLLLAMIHEGDGVAGQVLKGFGFTLGGTRKQVEEEIVARGDETPQGHIPLTERAQKVLDLSLREALQLGHNYISTEHLLLGLVREGQGLGAQILTSHGCTLNDVRIAVLKNLGLGQKQSTPPQLAGTSSSGEATVEWGPSPQGYVITAKAPIDSTDELIALLADVRDEIANVNDAVRLLEKFGFTVTPPQ